jgi:PPOX class probable F420-dependent enzyme
VPSIPTDYHDLFEKPTIAHLSTLLPDGSPHSAPVWIDHDEDTGRLLVNTERGRRKEKNVRKDPRVAVSMTDPENPYRMLSVRGEVVEVTTEGAREHIDLLAKRYMGEDEYPNPIQTERVVLRIAVEHVATMGA